MSKSFARLSALFPRSVLVAAILASVIGAPRAQESVNAALDECVRKEQVKMTAKGAALGALAGLLKSAVSDNQKGGDVAKNMAVGAAAGGAIGFVTAHFKAVGTCYKKHPDWIPESKIQRGRGYEQALRETGYKPEMGVAVKVFPPQLPPQVEAGTNLPLKARFLVMTPDGAEADVVIERKLFVSEDGAETQITFPGQQREQRKLEAGESIDEANLQIPNEMRGSNGKRLTLRYEFSVAVADKAPVVSSSKVVIN